jgi:dihydrofolate reductase / thymidylate synthase
MTTTTNTTTGKQNLSLIVAATEDGGIGLNGQLPWSLPSDLAYFRRITSTLTLQDIDGTQNALIMGRNTWLSIPSAMRPLKNRINVVLSNDTNVREKANIPNDVLVATSVQDAISQLRGPNMTKPVGTIFIIGGASAFAEALQAEDGSIAAVDTIYLTRVFSSFTCDVHIPAIDDKRYALVSFEPRKTENEIEFQFRVYKRRSSFPQYARSIRPATLLQTPERHEEYQYLDAIRDIIMTGVRRDDRTGTGTIAKFGLSTRFSLRNNVLPLLTTKRVFWRGVAEELLWFISGNTSAKTLQDKGIHIWDGNGSREFLDGRGLKHREVGDLGPVYGFQWRHFGAEYVNKLFFILLSHTRYY